MPCNTRNTSEIDLSKASPDILRAALLKLGYNLYTDTRTDIRASKAGIAFNWTAGQPGRVYGSNSQDVIDNNGKEIKRAYSAAAVEYAAKRNGWTLKQTAPNQYQAIRR